MSDLEIVTVEPVPMIASRMSSRRQDLPIVIPKSLDPVWAFLRSKPEIKFGFNVVVYLDGPNQMEIGVQVPGRVEPPAGLIFTHSPAGLAAHGVHLGPYSELGRTYDALHALIAKEKLKMKGPFWEVYGHHNDDPRKLRTDIYYLVEKPR